MKSIKKRYWGVVLSVILVAAFLPFGVFEAKAEISGVYTYTVKDDKATITKCDADASGELSVPSVIGGYAVKCIGNSAFQNCTKLTAVTIPDSITTIGTGLVEISNYCFARCIYLNTIKLNNGLTKNLDKSASES